MSPVGERRVDEVMRLYAQAWWTRDRDARDVAAMLRSAQPTIGAVTPDDRLVAFVRVLTDFRFKAVVVDLIVDAPHRRAGLGGRLVRAVVEHPALKAVEDVELYCDEDLVPYYASHGFAEPPRTRFMRRSRSRAEGTIPLTAAAKRSADDGSSRRK